ncbi:MAG: hypothetical protein IKU22_02065 [Alistipes sp.]|nr:hypothetical protein [Alistipes sp.]
MKKFYFMAVAIVCLMASCSQNDMFENEYIPVAQPGSEVLFTAISNDGTRTVYGDDNGSSIAIKWCEGDAISVYGSTCSRKQADYDVVPGESSGTENGLTYHYAKELNHQGDYGVQWGEEAVSDFYAVYPAVQAGKSITPTNDVKGVVAPMSIASTQYNEFAVDGTGVIKGTPVNPDTRKPGLPDVIMYAVTKGATPTDENGNPKSVDLRFKPYSTVLKFSIGSWSSEEILGNNSKEKIVVNKITLTAPEGVNIAGNFDLTIKNTGDATVSGGTKRTIVIQPTAKIDWTIDQSLEFSVFAIPVSGEAIRKEWKVVLEIDGEGYRNITLKPTGATQTPELQPGKIHKLNIPNGPTVSKPWVFSVDNWMTTIPRNVYISDISMPGAWYATDSGYQGNYSLTKLHEAGIRAFNIDTRLTITSGSIGNANGAAWYEASRQMTYEDNYEHVAKGKLTLVCAGTEDASLGSVSDIGKTVKSALIDLGKLTANYPDEYIEVILTVAQKPKTQSGFTYGTVNAKMMLEAIANVLNDADVKGYIYGNKSGESITPNTTLGDVKGKLVVKVNANTSEGNFTSWNYVAPMLISEGSMAESDDSDRKITQANFKSMNSVNMYWAGTAEGYKESTMKYHYHQAQDTRGGSMPTEQNRKDALKDIASKSDDIYTANTHDAMFQMGIGGWTNDDNNGDNGGKGTLSKALKPYVYGIVNSMLTGNEFEGEKYTPAPVGAVLMNHAKATTNSTAELIQAIIELNGKYFLNFDASKPAWPSIDTGGSDEGGQNTESGGNGNEGDQGSV